MSVCMSSGNNAWYWPALHNQDGGPEITVCHVLRLASDTVRTCRSIFFCVCVCVSDTYA